MEIQYVDTTLPARNCTSKRPFGRYRYHQLTASSSDTCRLALLSCGRPDGSVVNALWSANWRAVLDQMQILFVCGSPRSGIGPSGGYMPFISTQHPFSILGVLYPSWVDLADRRPNRNNSGQRTGRASAALYIYSAFSPFEGLVNVHMSEGLPITPVTSMDQQDVIGRSSFVSLTNSTRQIQHMPVDFSLPRDITLLD